MAAFYWLHFPPHANGLLSFPAWVKLRCQKHGDFAQATLSKFRTLILCAAKMSGDIKTTPPMPRRSHSGSLR